MNLEIPAFISLVLAAVSCGLFLANLSVYRPLAKIKKKTTQSVSVLIPARNEEQNIRSTLRSVLANRGIEFEVIVLDDHSTDGTAKIVSQMTARDPRVRLEIAPPLPAGWCGKQHSCHVLAGFAQHALLVFIDADVRLASDALVRMAAFMEQNEAALASGVPRQELGTFSERLLIPLIHFILLGFLPMHIMQRTKSPAFSAGCGQLFILRRDAYQSCGGHAEIRDSLHDGIKLPRLFRRAGFQTDLFDATDLAICRMYNTNTATWHGLGKNAMEGLAAPATILPTTALLVFGQIVPFSLLFLTVPGSWVFFFSAVGSALALLPRMMAVRRFRQPWLGALLHPLGVLCLLGIQWHALLKSFLGRPMQWKGRDYLPSKDSKTSGTRILLAIVGAIMLSVISLSAGPASSAMTTTNLMCAGFTLPDQFGTNHVVKFPQPKPMVLMIADRKGSEQIEAWVEALKKRYGGRIEMTGVANVSGVPGWMQGMIRKKFRKQYARPIVLDWSGKLPASLPCQPEVVNIFLLDETGRVLAAGRGECDQETLDQFTQSADEILKSSSIHAF